MHDSSSNTTVLVPVKSFTDAKHRLAGSLDATARARLARSMAERVLAAAAPLRVAVVCDDVDVAEWAGDRGARVLWEPAPGLDQAVAAGVERLRREGSTEVLVVHGDLPLAADLARLAGAGGVTLVPDRHGDGTNVIAVPTSIGFRFSYGPGSFLRHRAEATRLGLAVRVLEDPALGCDIDEPDDLAAATELDPRLLSWLEEISAGATVS